MRKINKLLVAATTTALILTGCVGRKKEEQKADPNKKVEITYWDFPQFTKDKEFT